MSTEARKGIDYPGVSVVFWCHDGKGNYAMHRRGPEARDENGKWDCGSGGLEVHDNVLDRLRTEVKEEYCAEAKEIEFLGYFDSHREHKGEQVHWIALTFRVLVDPHTVKIGEPGKHDKIGWYTRDNLPLPMHPTAAEEAIMLRNKLI
ncbi:MAG TPA: NUDIX domain-containing protein [Candidatus Paceibacterota bacterium]